MTSQQMPEIKTIEMLLQKLGRARDFLAREDLASFGLPPSKEDFSKWIKQLEHQRVHSTQKFTVMVLGEYNAGKSTLLNALLELPKPVRLPSYDEPTNAVPIRLSAKSPGEPEAKWILFDGAQEKKTWKEVLSEACVQDKSRSDIREVQVFMDHPLLRCADIMDMPGTGTAYFKEHTEVTRDYIANSEMVIWVIGHQEPSREGLRDFRLVLEHEVPVTVVFNAWGYLDSKRNEEIYIDQSAIEQTVRDDFPEAFQLNDGYRVYAQKVLEAQDQREEIQEEWGVTALRQFFLEEYLGEFVHKANKRRKNVFRQVARICNDALRKLEDDREAWDAELGKCGEQGETFKAHRNRIFRRERSIMNQIRPVAGDRATRIFDYVGRQAEVFINDTLIITNFELWKNSVTEERRLRLERDLNERFVREYLKLNQSSWLHDQVKDYLEDCLTILEAQWRNLDDELIDEKAFTDRPAGVPTPPNLPFDQIRKAAMGGIKDVLARLLGAGAVFGALLFIPGGQIVDAIVLGAYAVISVFRDPMEKYRVNAVNRFRNELDMQHSSFKLELTDQVMSGPNAKLRKSMFEKLDNREAERLSRAGMLGEGLTALDDLRHALDEVARD